MADLFLVWKCPKCGEEIEETFDTCWRCGTSRGGTPVEVPSAVEASPVPSRGGREPSQKAQTPVGPLQGCLSAGECHYRLWLRRKDGSLPVCDDCCGRRASRRLIPRSARSARRHFRGSGWLGRGASNLYCGSSPFSTRADSQGDA